MKALTRLKALLALVLLATTMIACDDDDNDTPPSAPSQGNVKVIHASFNAPNVDVYVDDAKALTDVPYKGASAYLKVNAGSRALRITATGQTGTVLAANANIEANKSYSVFAYDSVSKIKFLVLEDNLAAPASGNAHVRVVHLSPNAPAVDIVNKANNQAVSPLSNLSFGQASAFTPLPAGTYNLGVAPAGTTTIVLNLDGVVLEAGKIYTLYASGSLTGTGNEAISVQTIVNN